MPTSSPDWLRGYPQSLRDTLDAALRGTLAPPIVLTRLFLALHDTARILSLLSEVVSDRRAAGDRDGARGIEAVHALALRDPTALDEMRRVLAILHGDSQSREATNPSAIATAFDKAAELSPAASVALYSLGDPALLQSATHELVALLRDRELISRRTRVLEIGCGIGRFAQALASEVTSFIGIDVSCNMIRLAEERCVGLPNVTLSVTSGNDLRDYLGASFDLVLAVDSLRRKLRSRGYPYKRIRPGPRAWRKPRHLQFFLRRRFRHEPRQADAPCRCRGARPRRCGSGPAAPLGWQLFLYAKARPSCINCPCPARPRRYEPCYLQGRIDDGLLRRGHKPQP